MTSVSSCVLYLRSLNNCSLAKLFCLKVFCIKHNNYYMYFNQRILTSLMGEVSKIIRFDTFLHFTFSFYFKINDENMMKLLIIFLLYFAFSTF